MSFNEIMMVAQLALTLLVLIRSNGIAVGKQEAEVSKLAERIRIVEQGEYVGRHEFDDWSNRVTRLENERFHGANRGI